MIKDKDGTIHVHTFPKEPNVFDKALMQQYNISYEELCQYIMDNHLE
jgi:hypothetical protein